MTTYVIRRSDGQRTPLSDVMQGLAPASAGGGQWETDENGRRGPPRSELRKRLEAMAVGDEIDTVDRTANQVSAIAFHVRKAIPEARYRAVSMGTFTRIRRIA
jgi:hypothetical protein